MTEAWRWYCSMRIRYEVRASRQCSICSLFMTRIDEPPHRRPLSPTQRGGEGRLGWLDVEPNGVTSTMGKFSLTANPDETAEMPGRLVRESVLQRVLAHASGCEKTST